MEHVLPSDVRRAEIPLNTIGLNKVLYVEKWLVNGKEQWSFVESTEITVYQIQRNAQNKRILTPCSATAINTQTRYVLGVKGTESNIYVYAQKYSASNQVFAKYRVDSLAQVTIGSDVSCTFVLNRKAIAPVHIQIDINNDVAVLIGNKEVYVNNVCVVDSVELQSFDTICVFGIKFVYLKDIIAVNTQESVSTNLHMINELDLLDTQVETGTIEEYGYFSRAPRQLIALDTEKVSVEAPPHKKTSTDTPWFLTIGPTITMPMPMLCSVLINMQNSQGMGRGIGSYAGIMVSMVMTAGLALFWGQVRKSWQKKQEKKAEEKRISSYTNYITKTKELLEERAHTYIVETKKQYLTSYEMVQQLSRTSTWLWNRNLNHTDFGYIRIGDGAVLNNTEIEIPKERFSIDDDDALMATPQQVKAEYKYIKNTPVLLNVFALNMLGVTGDTGDMYAIMNSLIVQLAGLYSYTDVKIAICTSDDNKENFMWARFLPHMQLSDTDLRLFVYDRTSNERVVSYLVNLIQARTENYKDNSRGILPHYVIFCTDEKLLESDAIRNYANGNINLGITFILLFGEIAALPNNCTHVLQNDEHFTGINVLTDAVDPQCIVNYEYLESRDAELFARELCGYTVKEAVLGVLPTRVNFLETLGITQIEQWDLAQHYKEARTHESIRGLIGVGSGGALKYLDIHEKKHGPHGLIAGMTGSGKSEMLQTIIVSWAMTYSPIELSFVLIDYKGGGMANLFADLPHVVGVLTNLSDESSDETEENANNRSAGITNRALVSIKAEIKRRQTIFKRYKINHIDDYIKMYHRGEVTESLPHLVIISDEFAELRKEQHGFISELVSAARVGRSLGVHLILATQKPAGVVDDEISSNARYRLSLRVQDKADSMSMLKRPEAAYLTQIGRLYMQVGSDEIFEEIQAAYSGGHYMPEAAQQKAANVTCDMVQLDGCVVEFVDKAKKKVDKTKLKTELETCIEYVTTQVKKLKIPVPEKLWLPFLPKMLYLSDIQGTIDTNTVCVPYGKVDDVVKQRQYPIFFDCVENGNTAIVGVSGCGKSTLLQTMLYVFATQYTAADVQFYIYDYSSRILKMYNVVPHCGGVVLNDDSELEKAQRTMQLFLDLMLERRTLFDEADVGSYTEYNSIHKIPIIYLIIDDFASWSIVHMDQFGDKLLQMLRDGSKYGIYVLLTVNTTSEITYKMRQYINSYVTLQLPEKSAYRELWGVAPDTLPELTKGRGLTSVGQTLAEYQVLLAVKAESEVKRNSTIKQTMLQISKQATAVRAKPIPVLPRGTKYTDLLETTGALDTADRNMQFLVAYDTITMMPKYLNLSDMFLYTISDTTEGCFGALRLLKNLYTVVKLQEYTAKYIQLLGTTLSENYDDVIITDEQIYMFVRYLNDLYIERNKAFKQYVIDNVEKDIPEKMLRKQFVETVKPVFIFIDSLSLFVQHLQSEKMCMFSVSEKTSKETALLQKPTYTYISTVLTQGANYGIYFVACFDSESHTQRALPIYKEFNANPMGVHFGGCISSQYYVNGSCVGTYKQQAQTMPVDMAVWRNGSNESVVWVP